MTEITRLDNFILPSVSLREVYRYMGCKNADESVQKLVTECVSECAETIAPRLCFRRFDLEIEGEILSFEGCKLRSKDLSKTLKNCSSAVIFAATVGLELDRLIAKYGELSPSKAVAFQAIGAERIEAVCDLFCEQLKEQGLVTPRFSPGYGDLDITTQKWLCESLNTPKSIGVFLTESCLLTPTKSVTAIVGIQTV